MAVTGRGSWWARSVWMVLAALLATAPTSAQVDTGTIEVFTRGSEGGPLSGVTVEALHPDTGLRRTVVSNDRGAAVLTALPLGRYEVTARLESFATAAESDLELRVGQTLQLVMTLRVKVSGTVNVTARAPLVDVLKSDASTNIIPEQIEDLPTPDRDFQRLALIAPGVQRDRGTNRFVYGAPVVGSAGNASQTTVMVDGVDLTDQFLGQSRVRFSQEAVREFRVVNNRFDAEIGGSAAGALAVVTKSGTNDVRGTVYGFYRGDELRATGELESGDEEVWRYHVGFTLGGPITRDATHYFTAVEYLEEASVAPFLPGGIYQDLAGDIPRPVERLVGLGSLDHQPSPPHLLDLRLVFDRQREENYRAGGTCDVSCGMELDRDNWNAIGGHTWVAGEGTLNQLRLVAGRRSFETRNNSDELSRWFSLGETLQTGANYVGDQLMEGSYFELADTLQLQPGGGRSRHELKLGGSVRWIDERWDFPVYPQGLLLWFGDGPDAVPFQYIYGEGSADIGIDTTLVGLFLQDDWRVRPDLSVIFGLRYDLDTDGNNPDLSHPNSPGDRSADTDNLQPRLGFVWDLSGRGSSVLRGGVGLFAGRNLLVPAGVELQQNGTTGRPTFVRFNGGYLCFLAGVPPDLCPLPRLDPADPQNTGMLLPPNSAVLRAGLEAPEAIQASLGFSQRLGGTGLYLDLEALYAEGDREIVLRDVNWGGNSNPIRLDPSWTAINMYTNEGRSEYASVMASVSGVLAGGHVLTTSVSWGDKKNIADDFSPLYGPSDPADIEAEWGRARSDERWRVVLSGIFRLPLGFMVAPIFEYGSGTPWTRRLGYDSNGDASLADRAPGVPRNGEDGPELRQLSLRLAKSFGLGGGRELELIVEAYNLFNATNYDPNSVVGAEFLSGPTLANPTLEFVENPSFGTYTATLDPRLIQLGLRFHF